MHKVIERSMVVWIMNICYCEQWSQAGDLYHYVNNNKKAALVVQNIFVLLCFLGDISMKVLIKAFDRLTVLQIEYRDRSGTENMDGVIFVGQKHEHEDKASLLYYMGGEQKQGTLFIW